MRSVAICLFASALLCGCSTMTMDAAETAAAPPPPAPGALMSVRETLPAATALTSLAEPDLPHAFVLLTDPKDRKNNVNFCRTYIKSLPTAAYAGAQGTNSRLAKLYWPVTTAPVVDDCDALVDRYDYARATFLIAQYGLPAEGRQMILSVDQAQTGFYIDVTKANDKARAKALLTWFNAGSNNPGQPGTVIRTATIWKTMETIFCSKVVADNPVKTVVLAAAPGVGTIIGGAIVDGAGKVLCKKAATA